MLCEENHLANYKGCAVFKEIQKAKFPALRKLLYLHMSKLLKKGKVYSIQTDPPSNVNASLLLEVKDLLQGLTNHLTLFTNTLADPIQTKLHSVRN